MDAEALKQLGAALAHADEPHPNLLIGAQDGAHRGRAEQVQAQCHAGRGAGGISQEFASRGLGRVDSHGAVSNRGH